MSHDIVTPTAFIMGQVTVSGLRGRGFVPEIRIVAQGQDRTTEIRVKTDSHYLLLVSPGEWTVSAEAGGVVSEPRKIVAEPAKTVEVNFLFGRQE